MLAHPLLVCVPGKGFRVQKLVPSLSEMVLIFPLCVSFSVNLESALNPIQCMKLF